MKYQSGQLHDQDLLNTLQKRVTTGHTSLGYDGARKYLFGSEKFFLEKVGGVFAVTDVYCEKTFTDADYNGTPTLGPGMIPKNGAVLNVEHTWPQSKFTNRYPKDTQKSDLHHLFPTDSKMNSSRGSLNFGNVVSEVEQLKCPQAKLGQQENGEIVFEAPMHQRGNTARAIFYFALRYQMKMPPAEEAALRVWAAQDPIDQKEIDQNDEIEKVQGNRNPFIDFPDLLDHIQTFNVQYPGKNDLLN